MYHIILIYIINYRSSLECKTLLRIQLMDYNQMLVHQKTFTHLYLISSIYLLLEINMLYEIYLLNLKVIRKWRLLEAITSTYKITNLSCLIFLMLIRVLYNQSNYTHQETDQTNDTKIKKHLAVKLCLTFLYSIIYQKIIF